MGPVKDHWYIVFGSAVILLTLYFSPLFMNFLLTHGERYDSMKVRAEGIPHNPVGIVFGAGILSDGQPTPYLKNRLDTAVALYKTERVDKLLVSGDDTSRGHNEPKIMKQYLENRDVQAADILTDYAGYNTYDSCYRAKAVFGIDHATLITQGYHLPRAMTTCGAQGIKSTGVAATRKGRDVVSTYLLREFIATNKMLVQNIFSPEPAKLD